MGWRANVSKVWGAAFVACFVFGAIAAIEANAQEEDLAALNARVVELYNAGKYTEAIPLAEKAEEYAAAMEAKYDGSRSHVDTLYDLAEMLDRLISMLKATNRLAEAELLMRRALSIAEKLQHGNFASRLSDLARLLQDTGRLAEAEPLMRRALSIYEKNIGIEDYPIFGTDLALRLNDLADVHAELGDWVEAAVLAKRAMRIVASSRDRLFGPRTQKDRFGAAARADFHSRPNSATGRAEAFDLAQWALQTVTADALNQMAVRFAKGAGPLAALVRERQDLGARHAEQSKGFFAAKFADDAKLADQLHDGIDKIDADTNALDARIAKEFPDYAALSVPKPLSITAVQGFLASDEALVVFLVIPSSRTGRLPEETLIWAVTKDDAQWTSIALGTTALRERVETLRCGLDASAWADPAGWSENTETQKAEKQAQQIRRDGCKRLLGLAARDNETPPFDLAAAHELYKALFGPIRGAIEGRRLLVVASGPLTYLPLGVLVREPAKIRIARTTQDFYGVAWLANSHALTVLPSVASLATLRKLGKDNPPAAEPFLGVGNPLLDGDPGDADDVTRAKTARAKQQCPKAAPNPSDQMASAEPRAPVLAVAFRDGVADANAIRGQVPLPETADELCAIARTLHAPEDAVILGQNATETNIKAQSDRGRLARARVVQFATHGLLAAQSETYLKAGAEPGLILTPPAAASEADDGLLTASEVALLGLNAEWVVLSACNTAGGEQADAEPLSGLTRAFFYAGAKALLVSHWAVDSDAAVKLTTKAFAELEASPALGRAEAFRRSVAAMMADTTRPGTWTPAAHPAVWAPFVLVGEGGR